MRVYIFSVQREIAQVINDHLSEKNNLCFSFPKLEYLREEIEKRGNQPDLLILDYKTFNHDFFDIYHFFEKHKYHIPIVFYNEPCLIKPTRLQHWIAQIEYKQNHYLKINLENYKPILKDLEELIDSPEFTPYVSLLNPPKQLPKSLIKDPLTLSYLKENETDCIALFKTKLNLSPSLYYLLVTLQRNKSEAMSLEEIVEVYKKDNKQMTVESLKVSLSRLRTKIRQNPDCGFLINSSNQKYRFVRYKL